MAVASLLGRFDPFRLVSLRLSAELTAISTCEFVPGSLGDEVCLGLSFRFDEVLKDGESDTDPDRDSGDQNRHHPAQDPVLRYDLSEPFFEPGQGDQDLGLV
jgi:hypothetical protein